MNKITALVSASFGGGLLIVASYYYVNHPAARGLLPVLVTLGLVFALLGIKGYRNTHGN